MRFWSNAFINAQGLQKDDQAYDLKNAYHSLKYCTDLNDCGKSCLHGQTPACSHIYGSMPLSESQDSYACSSCVPKFDFRQLLNKHQTERNSRRNHFLKSVVSILFCYMDPLLLSAYRSGLPQRNKLWSCLLHRRTQSFGLKKAPPRSALVYADGNISAAMFAELFYGTAA